MIVANSIPVGSVAPAPTAPTPAPEVAPARPGKSGMAVGQLAKQAVAAAREAGMDVPKNAQGYAASQIAKGATPESIFAAQTADDSEGVEVPTEGDVDISVDADAPVPAEVAAPDPMLPSTDDTALTLAKDAETDRAIIAAAQYDLASTVIAASGDSSAQIALDLLS